MPVDPLATLTLTFHGATLIPVGIALQKFGDRGDTFQKSLAGTTEALTRLRRLLAADLERDVEDLLTKPASVSQQNLILGPTGQTFTQQPVNPLGSEAYRNCIHQFATRHDSALSSYFALNAAKDGWTKWSRRVSWSVLLLFVWEALAFSGAGVVGSLFDVKIPRPILLTSYAPTGILLTAALFAYGLALRQHDKILDLRRTHDPL